MHYHHEFAHAAVRGAGWAAGRQIEHALGLWIMLPLLIIAIIVGSSGKRK